MANLTPNQKKLALLKERRSCLVTERLQLEHKINLRADHARRSGSYIASLSSNQVANMRRVREIDKEIIRIDGRISLVEEALSKKRC